MPNSTNNKKGEQWDQCDRCGAQFPMSRLKRHEGLMICDRHGCTDDLTVDMRDTVIQQIFLVGESEGVDMRSVDRGFQVSQDDEVT